MPYLPKPAKTGRPRCDDRNIINGILFVLTTGFRWACMSDKYGSKSTAYLRFQEMQQKGMWKTILSKLIKLAHKQEKINLQKISIDSSSIAAKKRGDEIGYEGFKRVLGTRIHVAVDGNGLPISIVCSPANQHDSTEFVGVLKSISDFPNDDLIRQIVSACADKGYDAKCIRNYPGCHGINCCIPYKKNSKNIARNKNQRHHGNTGFVAGRFLAWLRCGSQRTAIRYERKRDGCLGFVCLARTMMYRRVLG